VNSTGEVQDENGSVSSAHSYVEPASVEENLKMAFVYGVGSVGFWTMLVSGGPLTVQRWLATLCSTLPASSIARTSNR
jgi:hypothetical protein